MGTGTALAVGACLAIGLMVWQAKADIDQRSEWLALHTERSVEPRLDLNTITGSVTVDPGGRLDLTLTLEATAPAALPSLLFTLNPGLEVSAATVNGDPVAFSQNAGLLDLAAGAAGGDLVVVELSAGGRPVTSFGYLDSAVNFLTGDMMDAQIGILGFDHSVYHPDYVGLMPASRWLPHPGTDVPASNPRTHPLDYFNLDLTVTVPDGWTPAVAGRRETDGNQHRFRPIAVVPDVGLFAAEFDRVATTVNDVEFELLVHPDHRHNLDLFADSTGVIETRLAEILDDADSLGLAFPYKAMRLVEAPATLRGYGGGWQMDSVQSLPGLFLVKESSFPSARFDRLFTDPTQFEEKQGGLPAAKLAALEQFFSNDVSGGNLIQYGSRNLLTFQTSARGEGAIAINFVLDQLVNKLLAEGAGFFSAHMFDRNMGMMVGNTFVEMAGGGSQSITESIRRASTGRPTVWDLALGTPLAELDPGTDPELMFNVLALKGDAISAALLDSAGREKISAMLQILRDRYGGTHFTVDEFNHSALIAGIELDALLGDWLHDSRLPGFLTSSVSVERLADAGDGSPQYQTTLHVRNDEPTPGLVSIRYAVWSTAARKKREPLWDKTEPILVGGNQSLEVGIVSGRPGEMWLHPYLSLNRKDLQLSYPDIDNDNLVDREPFNGTRPSDWAPTFTADIIVDDLDPGFVVPGASAVVATEGNPFTPRIEMDQGLPAPSILFGPPQAWSRRESPSSFGKYRRTMAVVGRGGGDKVAVFKAELPHSGRWRLDYHLPDVSMKNAKEARQRMNVALGLGGGLGTYELTLSSAGDAENVEFDGSAAESGWNQLGTFELAAGDVELEVTDGTSGGAVIADAIRFRPMNTQAVITPPE